MKIHFFAAPFFPISKQAASKEAAEKRFIKKEKSVTSLSIL